MKKWIKGCGIGCGSAVILFAVVVVVAWKTSAIGRASSETTETLAKAKALGLPLLASDLQRKPPLKPEENAYTILRKAQSEFPMESKAGRALGEFELALDTNATPQAILKALNKLGALPKQAEQFASTPHCDFNYDWDEFPYAKQFDRISFATNFAKVLCGRATAKAKLGQLQPALKDLRLAQKIGTLLRETPVTLHNRIAIDCDAIVAIGYELIISLFSHDSAKLLMIQKELDSWNQPVSIQSSIPGDFYLMLLIGRNPPGLLSPFPSRDKIKRSGEPRGLVARALYTRCLQRWIQIRQEFDKKPSDLKMLLFLKSLRNTDSYEYSVADKMIPVQSQESTMELNARRRCLRGLVASLSYRNAHGRYPKTLAEAGYRELDPFTDKPLKLSLVNGRFRVYSMGPDGVDNQGQKKGESKTPDQFDVVASCPVK